MAANYGPSLSFILAFYRCASMAEMCLGNKASRIS